MYHLVSGKVLCSLVFDVACTAVTMDCTETRLFTGTIDGRIFLVNCYLQVRFGFILYKNVEKE